MRVEHLHRRVGVTHVSRFRYQPVLVHGKVAGGKRDERGVECLTRAGRDRNRFYRNPHPRPRSAWRETRGQRVRLD